MCIDDDLIAVYMDRFVNRTDIWGKQWVSFDRSRWGYAYQQPDMKTKGGRFRYEPMTPVSVARVFRGELSCAWCAIDQNGCSRWLSFDSDIENGELDKLEAALRLWGLHVIREGRRPGRAGHLWVLFDKPVPVKQLIVLSNAMMKFAGVLLKSKQNPDGIERFPGSDTGLTQVRAPFSINLKPDAQGARGWFDGVQQDLQIQLQWLARQPLNRAEDAIREAEKHRPKRAPSAASRRLKTRRSTGLTRLQILDHVDARSVGSELVAQCPVCASEGHDQHRDNLRIKPDGSAFCCVYGGPNQVHQVCDIALELLRQRGLR